MIIVQLQLWELRALGMPDWSYALNAAAVAVVFTLMGYRLREVTPDPLPTPRTLTSEADRQTAASLAAQYSSEAQHSLLGWLAVLSAAHPAAFAWSKSARLLTEDAQLGILVFGALGLLCFAAKTRIKRTQERTLLASHVLIHQAGIGRFARDVHSDEPDVWTGTLLPAVLNGLGQIWFMVAGALFLGDVLGPFL